MSVLKLGHQALKLLLLLLLLLLFSRLYNVFTSSCAHLKIILSSSSSSSSTQVPSANAPEASQPEAYCANSSSYFCHSSLLHQFLFSQQSFNPFRPGEFGSPSFFLPGGRHFITSFGNLPSSIYIYIHIHTRIFIHSFSILSDDRSKASPKTMPPHSVIQSFLLQMRVSSPVLKVIQQLLTFSSSSSCHFHLPLYFSFDNLFQKAVST